MKVVEYLEKQLVEKQERHTVFDYIVALITGNSHTAKISCYIFVTGNSATDTKIYLVWKTGF